MKEARTNRKHKSRAIPKPRQLFLGSWKLVSYEHILPSGEIVKPFGDAPSGVILYQAGGEMSVHISAESPPKFAGDDPFRASAKQAALAWRSYFGYWGTFGVDAKRSLIVHRVQGASFSNWAGTEQARHFRFEGSDRLVLETESASGRFIVTWRRVRSRQMSRLTTIRP